ncbi:phosphoenolpyruvate synthase [Catellatospora sp. IY07-71]|uniref:PEP/pyruvate-binding domain-containing protein n=1 Tax=Catellatospora sp. IY07-71 TaxID=2728827 RepID=UPI001BB33044|nr:PEP/pyruvate-binding domain-containing protein [Catellatospora sp. IY07-71]BCJ73185.1 phosphoenolpyruvate synthase [Catellatospora sp. IY07-71]
MSERTMPAADTPTGGPAGLVLDFAGIDAGMLAVVGGKAANLGVLTRAGLPVPPGLCLTTEAYRVVAASAHLDEVYAALARTAKEDVPALTALAGRARAALLAAPIPAEIADAVAAGYARLGDDVPVAVRSSATAEDLPFASFAGQQDTYLNIVGEDAVLDAVCRCWASLWTDRAVVYRAVNGIDDRTVRLAVVVQRMVDSAVAGVMFTADPVTGHRHRAVIDAGPGLGEAVVSGAVNPDHFVVDTPRRAILDRRLGDKRLAIRSLPGGGTEHVTLDGGADQACLSDAQVLALAELGERVEAHYGAPQDTEWAVDGGGTLWLTQARPVTTLFPLPEGAPAAGADTRVYFCFSVAQGVFRPITPMGMAAFRVIASGGAGLFGFPVADPLAGPAVFAPAGQRVFLDVTTAVRSTMGRTLIPKILGVMEARSGAAISGLFGDPRLSNTRRSRLPFVRRVGRVAVKYRIPLRLLRTLAKPGRGLADVDAVGGELDRLLTVPPGATAAQRLDFVQRTLQAEVVHLVPRVMPVAAAGFVALGIADRLLGADAAVGDVQAVLRGIPNNVTTDMDLELWALAVRLRADAPSAALFAGSTVDELAHRYTAGTMPPVARDGVAAFLARYGHRAVAEIDLGMPRWSDDPRYILGVLANYLRMDPGDPAVLTPDRLFAQGAAEAEAMVETLAGRASRRGRLRGRAVRTLLGRARALAGVRELPKYYMVRVIAACRAQLALVGAELAKEGRLAEAGDVYFVDLAEARAGLAGTDLRDLVARRRHAYDEELRRRHIPRVLLSDGTEPGVAPAAAADGALTGTPASAGQVTGVARVIMDPVGAHLEPGEILVAPSTDPGWTPLFLTAGGLVMEMGGANSHGAVVAREYGIPAVVGVPDATGRITTGQLITVDGAAGTVTPS